MTEQDNASKPKFTSPFAGLLWWTTLVMAVIAVPLIGTSVALAMTDSQFTQMLIFIGTCWACVWLGMWLMKKADEHEAQRRQAIKPD